MSLYTLSLAVLWCKDLVGRVGLSIACGADSAAGAAVNIHCFHAGKDREDLPPRTTTPPPEQFKPEAESPGNPDSRPSLAQADPGSDPQGSGGGNKEEKGLA